MKTLSTIGFAFVLLLISRPILAEEQVLTLDPETSRLTFLLGATGHDVEGLLSLEKGEIRLDLDSGTATGEVTLAAQKSETGNKRRDKTLHHKVLESDQHPWITFRAEQYTGHIADHGASQIELIGSVSLLGVEHPMTLPIRLERDGDRFTAETTFSVPYIDWGLHDPSLLFLRVAKEVAVSIAATGSIDIASTDTGSAEPIAAVGDNK